MFDNEKENRPRFDTQTGEPIHYDDEMDLNTERGTEVTDSDFNLSDSNVQGDAFEMGDSNGCVAPSDAGTYVQTENVNQKYQSDSIQYTHEESENNPSQYRYAGNNIPYNNNGQQEQNFQNSEPLKTVQQLKADKKAAKKAAKEAKRNNSGKGGKSSGFVKKATQFVAVALVFGIVAGSSAYGVFYAGGRVFPVEGSSNGKIEIPTVNPSDLTGNVSNIINENTDTSSGVMNVQSVVQAAMPAIVAINGTVSTGQGYYNPYGAESNSSGTGIIVGKSDKELLIVTNAHVVEGVNNLKVVFTDGSYVSATVKGSKSDKDIAVIAVTLSDINSSTLGKIAIAELGDSGSVEVGEQVVAIGNALGEGQSVTVGWISALNRSIVIDNTQYTNLFMTDAAINPGNSGGALLNSKGQVIGINSAKYSSEQVEGMGYAIPVSSVKDIIDNLMNRQTRNKVDESKASYLGISGMDVTNSISSTYGYPKGIMISQVVSASAAEKAGLKKYDILVSFDDITINSFDTLKSTMEYYAAGEKVTVEYYHIENGEYVLKSVDVTLDGK